MATSTFDRPLVLTEKGVDNLFALWEEWEKNPPPPDGIKPYTQADRERVDALLEKYWFKSKQE